MNIKTCFEIIGPQALTQHIIHTCGKCMTRLIQVRSMATEHASVTLLMPQCECFEMEEKPED